VVLATHDRALASKLCDRALTLHEGRAAAWTPPTDRGEVGGGPDQTGSPPMAPHLAALQPGGGTP
jgi:ABC-type multidrug transport system ATPase subunit